MRGHAQEQQLVGAEPQGVEHRRGRAASSGRLDEPGEHVVEPAPPPQRPEHELVEQARGRARRGVPRRRCERVRERGAAPCATRASTSSARARAEAARSAEPRAGPQPRARRPGRGRHGAAALGLDLDEPQAACRRRRRRSTPLGVDLRTTVPGSRPRGSRGASRTRSSLSRRPSWSVKAPGQGWKPRARQAIAPPGATSRRGRPPS